MTPFRYSLIVALGLGLMAGNYLAWGLFEYGIPEPTRYGALAVAAVAFPLFVVMRRMAR